MDTTGAAPVRNPRVTSDRSSKFDEGDPKPKGHDGKKCRWDERNHTRVVTGRCGIGS